MRQVKVYTGRAFVAAALGALLLSAVSTAALATDDNRAGYDIPVEAEGVFLNTQGEEVGSATLKEGETGVLIRVDLHDMPPGEHAIHIHETGDCTPVGKGEGLEAQNYFSNAGGHLNPSDAPHGFMHEHGPHAGDMPNLFVDESGKAQLHIFNDRVMLNKDGDESHAALLDDDGSAIVIHAGTDDYESQPTGKAGHRIACAVIQSD